MSVNDKGIVDTLKECPENGFRMLMMKYQEPVYWHIRLVKVYDADALDESSLEFGAVLYGVLHHIVCGGELGRVDTHSVHRAVRKQHFHVVSSNLDYGLELHHAGHSVSDFSLFHCCMVDLKRD